MEKEERSSHETLYMETTPREHAEMYLKAIKLLNESGEDPVRVVSLAKKLGVAPPSVVQMLSKLEQEGYVSYGGRSGVKLTKLGDGVATRILRNARLLEVLMEKHLGIIADERIVCGVEHHMTEELAEALCKFLNHPRKCPHGIDIPPGKCCRI